MIGWLKCGRIKEYSIGLIAQIKKILASFFNVFVNCSPALVSQHKPQLWKTANLCAILKLAGLFLLIYAVVDLSYFLKILKGQSTFPDLLS